MPTLSELRAATTDRLAPHIPGTAGIANAAGTAWTGRAIDNDKRRIISTDLLSMDAAGSGPENPTDYLKNEWLYLLTSPPQQRHLPEGGYGGYATADEVATGSAGSGDTEVGYLDLERPLTAVVNPGTAYEIHAIPPLRAGRHAGVHAAINRALRVMLREDTVAIEATSGTYRYDVTTQLPWATPEHFVSAHFVETVSGLDTWAVPGAHLRYDGNTILLVPNATYSTDQEFPVRLLRPLSSYVKTGGTWGESTVGLVDEEDECLGNLDSISLVAAFYLAEQQADGCRVGTNEQVYWMAKAKQLAERTPFLRDQRVRRPDSQYEWPDFISPHGRFAGRWGPGFR
jgi:hypothetical protein